MMRACLLLPFATLLLPCQEPVPVEVGAPVRETVYSMRTLTRPHTDLVLRAPADGSVSAVLVQPGEFVKPGQELVEMSCPELAAAARIVTAEHGRAVARYDLAVARARRGRLVVEQAEAEVERLAGSGRTATELAARRQSLAELRLDAEVLDQETVVARSEERVAQALRQRAEVRVAGTTLRAPSSGLQVAEVHVVKGDQVARGETTLVRLVSTERHRILLNLGAPVVAYLSGKRMVTVQIGDRTLSLPVRPVELIRKDKQQAVLDFTARDLVPGTRVWVRIPLEFPTGALPRGAATQRGRVGGYFVLRGGKAVWTVMAGADKMIGDAYLLREPIPPGSRIILSPPKTLVDGASVVPREGL